MEAASAAEGPGAAPSHNQGEQSKTGGDVSSISHTPWAEGLAEKREERREKSEERRGKRQEGTEKREERREKREEIREKREEARGNR